MRTKDYKPDQQKVLSPRKLITLTDFNLLGWSPDGNWILYKQVFPQAANQLNADLPSVIFRISKNRDHYTAYSFKEDILISCANADCSDFLLNFPSLANPLVMYFQGNLGMPEYAPTENAYFPCALIKKPVIAFHKTNASSGELYLWNRDDNHLITPLSSIGNNLVPISWRDENTLLCSEEFSFTNNRRLVLVNFQQGTKTVLPFINSEFCDWSPGRSKLLIRKYSTDYAVSMLYMYDLNSTITNKVINKHLQTNTAFFGQTEGEIFYLINNNLKLFNINTGKNKHVLSNVSMPSLNPERTQLIYSDSKKKQHYAV